MMLRLLLFLSCFVGTSWSLAPPDLLSRRSLFQQTILATTTFTSLSTGPITGVAHAAAILEEDPRMSTVKVRLAEKGNSLGVQVVNTKLRGRSVVVIERVVLRNFPQLQEGMILKDYASAQDLVQRIRSGPFPVDLEFINLAAGGDAFSDPKDALEFAQQTDDYTGLAPQQQQQTGMAQRPQPTPYSITTLSRPQSKCAIQSRRGDVLEINYEAAYYETAVDGSRRKVTYDASSFRGTGQPYQMVMGSGDMIPGVDQGLYDMCPGDIRVLTIPPVLGYGGRALKNFKIPLDYMGLEWRVELVSIDTTIRQDNNDQTREEREGRALY
jgi:FKBP-type peptidyl-prolyl cis-trans isomerase